MKEGLQDPDKILKMIYKKATIAFNDSVISDQGDLAAGIATLGDVALDQLCQPVDLAFAEAQRLEIGG